MRQLIDIVRAMFAGIAGLLAYFAALVVQLVLFILLMIFGFFLVHLIVPETWEVFEYVMLISITLGMLLLSAYLTHKIFGRFGVPSIFFPAANSGSPTR